MNSLRTIHLTSVADLRAEAAAWDGLWQRSDVSLPLVRAELLAQWVEHFAPRADFHALVVADQSRWVAALPLVSCRVGRLIPAGGLPCNPWAPCGDLLCDAAAADNDAAMDLLVAAAAELPWPLLWLRRRHARGPALAGFAPGVRSGGHCRPRPRTVPRRPPRDRSGLGRLSETIGEEPPSGDESSRTTARRRRQPAI